MEMPMSLTEVQRLYQQWQDGKLLDTEERIALRLKPAADRSEQTFADVLRSASQNPTVA